MTDAYTYHAGQLPLLVSIPHAGTQLTPEVEASLNATGRTLADTDWHIPLLYEFLQPLGASIIQARYSRYVIDINRPPDDKPLYATATTGLYTDIEFDGRPIFDQPPSAAHRRHCLEHIWKPYHARIEAELEQLKRRFGYALLFDAHSIRSVVPRLFEGRLPDLNIGTNAGASCSPGLTAAIDAVLAQDQPYSYVINGHFKGGYITRTYGRPAQDIHAVQLELAQCNYMREAIPFDYDPQRAQALQRVLQPLIQAILDWGRRR